MSTRPPLIDPHRHLDGSVRLETILELGRQHDIPLPGATLEELRPHVVITTPQPGLIEFLAKFRWMTGVLADYDACRRVARENVEDAKNEGIRYIELRFSPCFMADAHNLDPSRVTAAVIEGVREGAAATGVRVNLIGILTRTYGPVRARRELRALLDHRAGITALDLAGDEGNWPAELFIDHFREGRDAGWEITVHAGEAAGASSIVTAIEKLAPRASGTRSAPEDPVMDSWWSGAWHRGEPDQQCTDQHRAGLPEPPAPAVPRGRVGGQHQHRRPRHQRHRPSARAGGGRPGGGFERSADRQGTGECLGDGLPGPGGKSPSAGSAVADAFSTLEIGCLPVLNCCMLRGILFVVAVMLGITAACAQAPQLSAYEALRSVGSAKGGAMLANLVEMRGLDGDPQPAQWVLSFKDDAARGGIREFTVGSKGITAERTPLRAGDLAVPGVMAAAGLNLDSTGVFDATNKEAAKAKLGFQSLNYRLQNRSGSPVWTVQLFDVGGNEAGMVEFSAKSGTIVTPLRIATVAAPVTAPGPVAAPSATPVAVSETDGVLSDRGGWREAAFRPCGALGRSHLKSTSETAVKAGTA